VVLARQRLHMRRDDCRVTNGSRLEIAALVNTLGAPACAAAPASGRIHQDQHLEFIETYGASTNASRVTAVSATTETLSSPPVRGNDVPRCGSGP